MLDKMFKAANTVVEIVRSKPNTKDEPTRLEIVNNYKEMVAKRKLLIETTRDKIQTRIEDACRYYTRIQITDLGFERVSSHLYEDSWQEAVVKMLEMDGYLCIMSFGYKDGQLESSLTVSWGK